MRSIGRVAAAGLATVALAMSGGAAWAADDLLASDDAVTSGKAFGPPAWAVLDCPVADLDPQERAELRTEHRAMRDRWREERRTVLDEWRTEGRAEMDAVRSEHRELVDQAGDLTPEERAELLDQLDQLWADHWVEMQELREERQTGMQGLREERRAERVRWRAEVGLDG